jgi:hypothetical protein
MSSLGHHRNLAILLAQLVAHALSGGKILTKSIIPATDDNSSSASWNCSMANLVASGDGGLCVGGVGRDMEGAVAEIRASREGELGPS